MVTVEDLRRSLIGPGLEKVRRKIAALAATDLPVLILGESGSGKMLAAQAVAGFSGRPMNRFLTVNAATLVDSLADDLLFGHGRGAFTGAMERRDGYIEAASGGTLFVDEIAELSLAVQAKLLGVVEQTPFYRLGETRALQPDFRLILATNADLSALVRKGRFREDLLHRLVGSILEIPPLRTRADDIPELVEHFIRAFSVDLGLTPVEVTDETLRAMKRHAWPGNVRQLKNVVGLAMQEFPGGLLTPTGARAMIRRSLVLPSRARGQAITSNDVEGAIKSAGGNISQAAALLGVSRQYVHRLRRNSMKRTLLASGF